MRFSSAGWEEALKDEKFKGELLTKLQPVPEENNLPFFKLPVHR